jgi:hypothetical protein
MADFMQAVKWLERERWVRRKSHAKELGDHYALYLGDCGSGHTSDNGDVVLQVPFFRRGEKTKRLRETLYQFRLEDFLANDWVWVDGAGEWEVDEWETDPEDDEESA